jgi:hypothetical protein
LTQEVYRSFFRLSKNLVLALARKTYSSSLRTLTLFAFFQSRSKS